MRMNRGDVRTSDIDTDDDQIGPDVTLITERDIGCVSFVLSEN